MQKPRFNPDKLVSLDPILGTGTIALSLHPSNLRKHPVLPIVVSIFLAGLGKDMILSLLGILVLAIWLCLDLLPLAQQVGVKIANHAVRSYRAGFGEREALERRARIRRAWTHIAIAIFSCSVGVAYLFVMKFIVVRHTEAEYLEVWDKIIGTPSIDTKGDPKFTFQNQSPQDIHLRAISCLVSGVSDRGAYIGDPPSELVPYSGDVLIHRGGDGQSASCSIEYGNAMQGSGHFICADIKWKVYYAISADPKKMVVEPYRYFLNPVTHEWSQIAIEDPPQNCPQGRL